MDIDKTFQSLMNYDNLSREEISATMQSIVRNKILFSPEELSKIFGKITKSDGGKILAHNMAEWGYDFRSDDLLLYGNPTNNRKWTIAHLMAKRGYIFTLDALIRMENPVDLRNLSVADVMMFMGHKFTDLEEKQLEIDHNNFEYSAYAGFFLLDYFKTSPKNPLLCPMCQHKLVGSSIKLSDAAYDGIGDKKFSVHDYSLLFVCSFCNWWYVRESWYEYERGFEGEVLLIGIAKTLEPSKHREEEPWENALKNKDAYWNDLKMPDEIYRMFPDYQETGKR